MERNKGLKARQELLRTIIRQNGGVTKISKLMGNKSKQFAENWIQRGAAPFVLTLRLSELLGIPQAAFNYVDYAIYNGVSPDWEKVVRGAVLTQVEQDRLLKLTAPEIADDVLWP